MGATIEKKMHWTCDTKGCNEHGNGENVPKGWRFVQFFEPNAGNKNVGPAAKCLFCPRCFSDISSRVSLLICPKQEATAA